MSFLPFQRGRPEVASKLILSIFLCRLCGFRSVWHAKDGGDLRTICWRAALLCVPRVGRALRPPRPVPCRRSPILVPWHIVTTIVVVPSTTTSTTEAASEAASVVASEISSEIVSVTAPVGTSWVTTVVESLSATVRPSAIPVILWLMRKTVTIISIVRRRLRMPSNRSCYRRYCIRGSRRWH